MSVAFAFSLGVGAAITLIGTASMWAITTLIYLRDGYDIAGGWAFGSIIVTLLSMIFWGAMVIFSGERTHD